MLPDNFSEKTSLMQRSEPDEHDLTPPRAAKANATPASIPSGKYRTSPWPTTEMPPGIPYIVGNEAAERFSYYGMKAILMVFMTEHLLGQGGTAEPMTEAEAAEYIHWFGMAAYFFPTLGAILSDTLWGKYRTIIALSLVYCLGHLALALDQTRVGLFLGLSLIAVGAGGIKPCVSAHVGDQFGPRNRRLLETVFRWFYFSINLGATASMVLTPWLQRRYGPHVAFAVPGLLMLLATTVFWAGRKKFVHIPPGGRGFLRESFSSEGLRAIGRLASIYVFVAVFWSLFDQTASSWVAQARRMDRMLLSVEILPDQMQSLNSILVMLFIPLFGTVVYPAIGRVFPLTPLRKISLGLFVAAAAFGVCTSVEHMIAAGHYPHIAWQGLAYVILTAAEIMVSITCLEFSYTQAPRTMKSFVMSLYMLSVSLGNFLAAAINHAIQDGQGQSVLSGAAYFWLFTGLMLATAVCFVPVAITYRGQTYIQDERSAA